MPTLKTVTEVAESSGIKPWSLYELIRKSRLPRGVVVRLGPRMTRINVEKWSEFIAAGGLAGGAG